MWEFEGIYATSRHIPHVRFPGIVHPGQLGCAPSAEVLAEWNKRETELIKTTELQRVVALPPDPSHTHPGGGEGEFKKKVQEEGARTIPCRPEHGGNCDIKNLSKGSKVWLPVHVKGAKFSVGDLHFSRKCCSPSSYASKCFTQQELCECADDLTKESDAEISFCGAIEMAGTITLKASVMKNGMKELSSPSPIYIAGSVEPNYSPGRFITFEGFSVDETGKQHYMDATVSYRQTVLRCIAYLKRYGTRPPSSIG